MKAGDVYKLDPKYTSKPYSLRNYKGNKIRILKTAGPFIYTFIWGYGECLMHRGEQEALRQLNDKSLSSL